MTRLIQRRLAEPDTAGGFVLDGYPRTVRQPEFLERLLARTGRQLDAAVLIDVPERVAVQRLQTRGRADDTRSTIAERLHAYRRETVPVIDRYRRAGLLIDVVNGAGPIGDVTGRILRGLGTA